MRSSTSVFLFSGALAVALAASGCTVNTSSNDECSQDSSVAGCGSAIGYSCTGNAVPTDSDSSLDCSDSTTDGDGNSLFCCTSYSGSSSSTCQTNSTVTCTDNSFGFVCTGSDTPDQSDSSLECSTGTPGNGGTGYCCIQYSSGSSSDCTQDSTVQGCASGSFGFSCTSSDTPQQSDSSLNCSTGTPGSNGDTLYCCTNQ